MRVFYYKARQGNFGDDLNAWIWRELWPEMPAEDADDKLLIGIGTILGMKLPEGNWRKFVVGSGVGYEPAPKFDKSWNFIAVRGPLSAAALGLDEEVAVTDSAVLLKALPKYQKQTTERKGIVFMPHLSARFGNWQKACEKLGIKYLNPEWDSKMLLDEIASAELMLADAMHGAITADTLRVRWVPLATSSEINSFKWVDWTRSMKLEYKPIYLTQSSTTEFLRDKLVKYFGVSHRAPVSVISSLEENNELAAKKLFSFYGNKKQSKFKKFIFDNLYWALKALNKKPVRYFFAPIDFWLTQYAVFQLKKASRSTSYLSDEKVLNDNLKTLLSRIENIK